jgi:predicted ABC-class ATPase
VGALAAALERLERRPYGGYREIAAGEHAMGPYRIAFDHVQGDPFAAPSRLSIAAPPEVARLAADALGSRDARRAAADFLQRALARALAAASARSGSGRSGLLEIAAPGPEILERTGVEVATDGSLAVRLFAGLPASGRRILGRVAAEMLCERLPAALDRALADHDAAALAAHVRSALDGCALRGELERHGLVAFLADGSVLPRASGAASEPLAGALPLRAPPELRVELEAPHAGRLAGLGIPRGVTLVVGGGYHGKSTLLAAIAEGVYDHAPGDGRERVVTLADAVAIRAEDGRSVQGVDLRPFIGPLPLGRGTERFESDDASGSTSQAAAIVEALEAGARALLVDEDTAATNFMIRDARMRRLVPAASEPITPFIDRVRQLWQERGVSSVLVVGGAGDYLDVADTVIQMQDYQPLERTAHARRVARALPLGEAAPRAPGPWPAAAPRRPDPKSLDPRGGRGRERVRAVRGRAIEFGEREIDVAALAQLVDPAQCRLVADALLALARGLCDGRRSLAELLDALEARMDADGIAALAAPGFGDRARARRHEIAAALNRLRGLRLV